MTRSPETLKRSKVTPRAELARAARQYGWVVDEPISWMPEIWRARTSKGKVISVVIAKSGAVARVHLGSGEKTLAELTRRDADKLARTITLLGSHAPRGTSNANDRGNVHDRRKRKQALLERDGNGEWALCSTCPTIVDFESATVDRYPLAGADGGKYGPPTDLSNVRLQCERCASKQGGHMGAERRTRTKPEARRAFGSPEMPAGRVLGPEELPELRELLRLEW